MNLQVGQTATTNGAKELKKQLVAAACGLALTVASVAGVSTWHSASHSGSGRAAETTTRTLASTGVAIAGPAQSHLYYLVGSQELADQLEFGLQSTGGMGETQSTSYEIVILDSPEAQAQFRSAIADAQRFAAAYGVDGPQVFDGHKQ